MTNTIAGIRAALAPRAILRAASSDEPRRSSQLEKPPPTRQPMPDAAYGIHAYAPTAFTSKWRTSYKYFGSQNK